MNLDLSISLKRMNDMVERKNTFGRIVELSCPDPLGGGMPGENCHRDAQRDGAGEHATPVTLLTWISPVAA